MTANKYLNSKDFFMERSIKEIIELSEKKIKNEKFYEKFSNLYTEGTEQEKDGYQRLFKLAHLFEKTFSKEKAIILSASGRTELSGNHTDHNHGKVLAASINLDKLALVSKRSDNKIIIYTDDASNKDEIDITDTNIVENEKNSSKAFIRGIAGRFKDIGYRTGGFEAFISNRVLIGSGLSSSASFEILVGMIFNVLYNESKITPVELAIIGRYAENVYFGKPCGLMDQIACAYGGIISIDFKDTEKPKIENVEYDFIKHGYTMMIVDTKGDHSNLTGDYAAIFNEMSEVAKYFGKKVCAEVNEKTFYAEMAKLREKVGDRAVLRAHHFFEDNRRVEEQIEALRKNDLDKYITLMRDCGLSSYMYLQNAYSVSNIKSMGLAIGYMATHSLLAKINENYAVRIHGGGFAGTIQAMVPNKQADMYKTEIEKIFGKASVLPINIRQLPVCEI